MPWLCSLEIRGEGLRIQPDANGYPNVDMPETQTQTKDNGQSPETKIDIQIQVTSPELQQIDPKNGTHVGVENQSFELSKDEMSLQPQKRFRLSKYNTAKKADLITYSWNNINVWTGREPKTKEKPQRHSAREYEVEDGSCWEKSSSNSKRILKNVYGFVRPGELMAIIGSSGAGKTSLLNVLTFRGDGKTRVSGNRVVNGVPIGPESLTSITAYIQQDDLFIGALTVREHLTFQALVRMHEHIPYKQRVDRVEEVIQELGLSKCADTKIGIPGRLKGISGGEMKRLSFASEILTDPPLMFCDEPTSGLDSYMAQTVVEVLKKLAYKGKTIICTIHQPSSQVYAMFDRILFLAEGRIAFLGDTKDTLNFFDRQGYKCPNNYNPSDFFIETLAIQPGNEDKCREIVNLFCDGFDASPEAVEIRKILETTIDVESAEYLRLDVAAWQKNSSPYKANWFDQFRALFWRSWISYTRDPLVLKIRLFQTVVLALLVGFIYFDQEYNQDGVQNINGVLFLFLTNLTLENVFAVIDVFCLELPIFLREHWNGMYRTDTYFIAKMLAEFPFFIIFPTLFLAISYFMIGLDPNPNTFLKTLGIITLVANTGGSFGYFLSSIASTMTMALALGPAIIIPFMLFGGYFLNSGSVPKYLVWIKYLSWFFYGNEALLIVQWGEIDHIECNRSNHTCPANGDVIIDGLNFNKENLKFDLIALFGLFIFYRVLAYFALYWKTLRKSN